MKFLLLLFALTIVSACAEDWSVAGKDYHNVKVLKVEDDLVSIQYDGGMGRLALADLSPELKKRFNYDPTKANVADEQRKKQKAQAFAESSKPVTNSAEAIAVVAQVTQVLPDGFLGSIMTKLGQLNLCFISCKTEGMIDGQSWTGKVIPIGTANYTDVTGASCTVAKFTDDLTAKASAMPQFQGYPRGPVSSTTSVGGG